MARGNGDEEYLRAEEAPGTAQPCEKAHISDTQIRPLQEEKCRGGFEQGCAFFQLCGARLRGALRALAPRNAHPQVAVCWMGFAMRTTPAQAGSRLEPDLKPPSGSSLPSRGMPPAAPAASAPRLSEDSCMGWLVQKMQRSLFPWPRGTGTADMSHRHQPLEQLSRMSNLQLESWKGEKIMIDAS